MSRSGPVAEVFHFGPSTHYVGGMASVITTMANGRLGASRAVAVPTWVPDSHVRSGLLAARATARVFLLPRSAAVHVHMSEGGSFLRESAIVAAARLRGLSRVITIHGPGFASFSARRTRLVSKVLRMASAITVLSDIDLKAVRSLAPHVHSELLPNPMPPDDRAAPVAQTSEIVLFAGEVGLRKGADVLRRAWDTVASSRKQASCIIVGPATEMEIADGERLEVRGPVSSDEVKRLIHEARVIALPSRGEALPMILIEAMAAGRPFVSTPTGGVETLAAGGLIVPIDDDQALANALIEVLADRDRAQSLGAAGKDFCERKMSPQSVGARLAELYSM
jgi:glycosyltransferase involved in cell wall biosynthesis